jgi:hypothetical protein
MTDKGDMESRENQQERLKKLKIITNYTCR